MDSNLMVTQGDQVVTVELTVKEAMALSGYRFNLRPDQLAGARRKIRKALDNRCLNEETTTTYKHLTH